MPLHIFHFIVLEKMFNSILYIYINQGATINASSVTTPAVA